MSVCSSLCLFITAGGSGWKTTQTRSMNTNARQITKKLTGNVLRSQNRTSYIISPLGEKAMWGRLNEHSSRISVIGNSYNQLSQSDARRLGRVALVVGGTGVVGRHICQALAERHVQTFSLSRRGGIQESHLGESLGMNYLQDVNWVEGDACDVEVWTELQPLLKNVNEVHICLPRTGAGAMLAAECIRRLREGDAHPQHITMLSVPSESTLGDALVSDWERAERLLQYHYPKDHRVLKPDSIHSNNPSLWGMGKSWIQRILHFSFMKDHSVTQNQNHAFSSLTRFHETKRSRYFAPSTHAGLIAQAAMEENIADLEGGEVRKLGTYELAVLPHRRLSRGQRDLRVIYQSPVAAVV